MARFRISHRGGKGKGHHHVGGKRHKGHKTHVAHHRKGGGGHHVAGQHTKGTSAVSGNAILAALQNDPAAMSALVADIASALFSSGFTAEIIAAIEAVVGSAQSGAAGRKLAGVVSTLAGALVLNGSSQAYIAMVFLGGSATAVACYVPTHIRATIATGQEVWVEPINGQMNDLEIVSIRNVF